MEIAFERRLFLHNECVCLAGRLLEEGNLEAAEEQKQRIEELQRERRRLLQESNLTHQPKFFR